MAEAPIPAEVQDGALSVLLVARLLARVESHPARGSVSPAFPEITVAVEEARQFMRRAYPVTAATAISADLVIDALAIALGRLTEVRTV